MAVISKRISQDTFDEAVQENIDVFEMEPAEALQQAISEFETQGVSLDGIIKDIPAEEGRAEHPVLPAVRALESALESADVDAIKGALAGLDVQLGVDGKEGAAELCGQNGGVQAAMLACRKLATSETNLPFALKTLAFILAYEQNKEFFHVNGGATMLVKEFLLPHKKDAILVEAIASAGSCAATRHEGNKMALMMADVAEPLVELVSLHVKEGATLRALCAILKAITTPDDPKEPAGGAFNFGRELAKAGAWRALLDALKVRGEEKDDVALTGLLCATLKNIAVNEEVCKQVANEGLVETILALLQSGGASDTALLRPACALLRQLAGSDSIKKRIVEGGGLKVLVGLLANICGGGRGKAAGSGSKGNTGKSLTATLEQAVGVLTAITLRNPDGAAAAAEEGCFQAVLAVMEAESEAQYLQRQACMFIRNAVARNKENIPMFLELGASKLLLKAKAVHPKVCMDVGSAALRDLGCDNYNEGWVIDTMVMGADGVIRNTNDLDNEPGA